MLLCRPSADPAENSRMLTSQCTCGGLLRTKCGADDGRAWLGGRYVGSRPVAALPACSSGLPASAELRGLRQGYGMAPDMCQHGTVYAVSDAANHDSQLSSHDTRLRLRQDPATGECRRGRALGGAGAAPSRLPPQLLGLRHAGSWVGPAQAAPLPVRARAGPAGRAGVRHAPRQLQVVQPGQGREGAP